MSDSRDTGEVPIPFAHRQPHNKQQAASITGEYGALGPQVLHPLTEFAGRHHGESNATGLHRTPVLPLQKADLP